MTAQPPQPEPGWYTAGPGVLQWWDGNQWTEHLKAAEQSPPAAPQPLAQMVTRTPVHTSHTFHLLMTLLTCGLWAVFVWLPITIINSVRREKSVTTVR